MTTQTEISDANRFMWKWLRIILALAMIGTAALIHFGNKPEPEPLWATVQTIEAKPSLEIVP